MNIPSCLVQKQYGWIFQECPGNSHPLFLTTTQSDTSFANLGVVTVGETHDSFVHLRRFSGSFYLLLRSPEFSIPNDQGAKSTFHVTDIIMDKDAPDVVTNASVEKHRVLRNHSNGLPQACLGDVPDILAVNQNSAFSFFEIVESVEQTQDRRLPCAGFTHKRDARAFRHFERNAIESGSTIVVREADVFCSNGYT